MKTLEEMLAGEEVIKRAGNWNLPTVVKIDRITKTQIIVSQDRYNRQTGRLCGECYRGSSSIHAPEVGEVESTRKAIKIHNIRHALKHINWECVEESKLLKIREAMQ